MSPLALRNYIKSHETFLRNTIPGGGGTQKKLDREAQFILLG